MVQLLFYLDVLQKQLVKRNVMLLCVWLDTVCHCCYDQFRCRHFVKHVERNTPHISLGGTQSILRKKYFFICTGKSKLGLSIVFLQFLIIQKQKTFSQYTYESYLLKDWEWKPAIVFLVKVQKLNKAWHQRFKARQFFWTITAILAKNESKHTYTSMQEPTNNEYKYEIIITTSYKWQNIFFQETYTFQLCPWRGQSQHSYIQAVLGPGTLQQQI